MGIPELRDLNLYLLVSWVQRYYETNDKLWKAIVDHRYDNCSPNIFCYEGRDSSYDVSALVKGG
jgi:hypothetical protein